MARAALGAVDTAAGYILACQWVAERYSTLCSRTRFKHLRRVFEVTVPANIDDGTVTVASGSTSVTGDATASAVWTDAVVGRHIRLYTTWYEIEGINRSVAAAVVLSLRSPYADQTAGAGLSYKISARRVALDPSVRWLGDFVNMYSRTPLQKRSLSSLDMEWPDRPQTGFGPYSWTELWADEVAAVADASPKIIEFYPYPDIDTVVNYAAWMKPPVLPMDARIPDSIDPEVLKEGVLIDVMRWNASKAANSGNIEAAAYWRNEYRMQSTTWERSVLQAIATDRGTDDVSLILERGAGRYAGRDITTAHEMVWDRFPS